MAQGGFRDYLFGEVALELNLVTEELLRDCISIQTKLTNMGMEPRRLGEIMLERGILKPEEIQQILEVQKLKRTSMSRLIPGYEIILRIGQGGMGSVFKARQITMDRLVALKVLPPELTKDRQYVERFLREVRAVGALNHPNIVGAFEAGEANGFYFYAMELVDGASVAHLLQKRKRLTEAECLHIALGTAKALDHAMKHGIVHRDIKPGNIMLTREGVVKICDMGLAKQLGPKTDASLTLEGMAIGTPNYISPEQATGKANIDTRADIYALGASLYQMATGVAVFTGPTAMAVMTKHVQEPPIPPNKKNPDLSAGFNAMVLKMLQKRPEDRYQTPAEIVQDIEKLLNGQLPSAQTVRPPTRMYVRKPATGAFSSSQRLRAVKTKAHHRALPFVIAASLAAAVLAAVAFARPARPKPETQNNSSIDSSGARSRTLEDDLRDCKKEIEELKTRSTIAQVYALYNAYIADPRFTQFRLSLQTERDSWANEMDKKISEVQARPTVERIDRALKAEDYRSVTEAVDGFPTALREFDKDRKTQAWTYCLEKRALAEQGNDVIVRRLIDDAWQKVGRKQFDAAVQNLGQIYPSSPSARKAFRDLEDGLLAAYEEESKKGTVTPKRFREAETFLNSLSSVQSSDAEFRASVESIRRELRHLLELGIQAAAASLEIRYRNDLVDMFKKDMATRKYAELKRAYREALRNESIAPSRLVEWFDADAVDRILAPVRLAGEQDYLEALKVLDRHVSSARGSDGQPLLAEMLLDLREVFLVELLLLRAMNGAQALNVLRPADRPKLLLEDLASPETLDVKILDPTNDDRAFAFTCLRKTIAVTGAVKADDVITLAQFGLRAAKAPGWTLQQAVFLSHVESPPVDAVRGLIRDDPDPLCPRIEERVKAAEAAAVARQSGRPRWCNAPVFKCGKSGELDIEYDFSTPEQLEDFEPIKWKGALIDRKIVDGAMRIGPSGILLNRIPFEGEVEVEVEFVAKGDKFFGAAVHANMGEGGIKGYCLVLDWKAPGKATFPEFGGGVLRTFPVHPEDVVRKEVGLTDTDFKKFDVKKDGKYTLVLKRSKGGFQASISDGTDDQNFRTSSCEFTVGRCGLFCAASGMDVKRFKASGKIEKAWLDKQH